MGIEQNLDHAKDLYTEAAAHGDRTAQWRLGAMYVDGRGVPQDYTKGADLLAKASSSGEVHAMMRLADLYDEGLGVPQDAQMANVLREAAVYESTKEISRH